MSAKKLEYFTIDELMASCMAQTIKDGDTVFNGVAVPLPFTAIMLACRTHAPNSIFWGGLFLGPLGLLSDSILSAVRQYIARRLPGC